MGLRIRVGGALRCMLAAAVAAAALGAVPAGAQSLKGVQAPSAPLTLKSRGSFFVGGQSVQQTPTQLSSVFGPPPKDPDHITIHQMYVEYMTPARETGVPVIMLHGNTLTGKTYDTTPDGRMGWYEYFVRRGHTVYIPDQISRGRSGIDVALYNDVRAGVRPPADLPAAFRHGDAFNWQIFRIGTGVDKPFADTQFPVEALGALSMQAVPVQNAILPRPDPNIKAIADLAEQAGGAVIMGHSATGALPLAAALVNKASARALILVEPGGCRFGPTSPADMAVYASVPILVVYGDHLDADTGLAGFSWKNGYDGCRTLISEVNAAGGKAQMLYPPDLGIRGNTHMIMQDRNNLQIADLILKWIQQNAPRRRAAR